MVKAAHHPRVEDRKRWKQVLKNFEMRHLESVYGQLFTRWEDSSPHWQVVAFICFSLMHRQAAGHDQRFVLSCIVFLFWRQVPTPLPVRSNASESKGVLLEVTRPTSTTLSFLVYGVSAARAADNRACARDLLNEIFSQFSFNVLCCRLGDDEWQEVSIQNGEVSASVFF